ncbi:MULTISPECIES: Imm50 family immunity protein [Streptomyces]|uniref:Imm50 family immunity protein n=1 Tax=Streptomyces TaxID=1883 RepID=UPI000D130C7F
MSGITTPTTRGPASSPHPLTSPFHPPAQDERGSLTSVRNGPVASHGRQETENIDLVSYRWGDRVRKSDVLDALYSDVPPLESLRLRSFHLDWRGPALTLRIDLPAYPGPDRVPPEWSERGHDTLQLHVQFTAVEDLTRTRMDSDCPRRCQPRRAGLSKDPRSHRRSRLRTVLHLQ